MKKILLSEAKASLLDMMKKSGEISVDDAVGELDLAKTTIRQHLQLLEQYGLVKRRQKREGRGRPRIMYSLTQKADQFYPSLEETLLRELVTFLVEQQEEELVDQFFDRHWGQITDHLRTRLEVTGDSLRGRLTALRSFLGEQGFVPEADKEDDQLQIRVCNCPYRSIVEMTHLPCERELELIEEVSGRRVRRIQYMPDGDTCCVYQLGEERTREN